MVKSITGLILQNSAYKLDWTKKIPCVTGFFWFIVFINRPISGGALLENLKFY